MRVRIFILVGLWLFSVVSAAENQISEFDHQTRLQLNERLLSLSSPISDIDYSQSLKDFMEDADLAISYGDYLVERLYQGEIIYGHHVMAIHDTLKVFIKSYENFTHSHQGLYVDNIRVKNVLREVLVFERYSKVFERYSKESQIRRIVDNQQDTLNMDLERFEFYADALYKKANLVHLNSSLLWYSSLDDDTKNILIAGQPLRQYIENSHLWNFFEEHENVKNLKKPISLFQHVSDGTHQFVSTVTSQLSWTYGKIAGNIKWRQGHLRDQEAVYHDLVSKLKPLDIIFEKRAFVATDYSIPGHWGHVSIWLGTKEDLVDLGIWDHPIIAPHQEKILNSQTMYEVRRWGLQFNDLKTFLNLDEIAVTRVKGMTNKSQKEILKIYQFLFDQIGKKYDFLFDAMTTDKVTCTEIIAFSFGPIDWPMDYIVGRYAITPNNIAELTLYGNSPVELISYYSGHRNGAIEHDLIDFAERMNYFPSQDQLDNSSDIIFEERLRKCSRERYRRDGRGAIRFHTECEDYFVHHRHP